jgi:hypothetical protein
MRPDDFERRLFVGTAVVCLILPWPVAALTHSEQLAGAAFLVPALVFGLVLRRRGWKAPPWE